LEHGGRVAAMHVMQVLVNSMGAGVLCAVHECGVLQC